MSDQIAVDPQFVIQAQQNRITELSQQLVIVEAYANQQQAMIASQRQQIEQLLSAMPIEDGPIDVTSQELAEDAA